VQLAKGLLESSVDCQPVAFQPWPVDHLAGPVLFVNLNDPRWRSRHATLSTTSGTITGVVLKGPYSGSIEPVISTARGYLCPSTAI
jgi:hypothetical protein